MVDHVVDSFYRKIEKIEIYLTVKKSTESRQFWRMTEFWPTNLLFSIFIVLLKDPKLIVKEIFTCKVLSVSRDAVNIDKMTITMEIIPKTNIIGKILENLPCQEYMNKQPTKLL